MGKDQATSGDAVRLDLANACAWRGAQTLRLTPKVFAVLQLLVEQAGRLVTKSALLDAVWPDTTVSDAAALTVCIGALRRELGDDPRAPRFIETVSRRGYRFI